MRLYALCDQQLLDEKEISIEEFIEISIQNGAEIIQYRNKIADSDFIKQQLIKMRKLYNGFLIVNDKYELVEFCDGVHLGQEDLAKIDPDTTKAVKILRHVIGRDKILGISTHNQKEVNLANDMDLNYIGLGPLRATKTKQDLEPALGERVDEIALSSKHFVAVIGGVKRSDSFKHVTYHVLASGLLE